MNHPSTIARDSAQPRPVKYDHDRKGNIVLPTVAPFDGKPILIKLATGWCEAWWCEGQSTETQEGIEYDGFCWVCMDDAFQADLDEASHWCPLPVIAP